MLFSVVDDRSGVAYQECRCVYGEDVEAALRFLFTAMAPKADAGDLFQGIRSVLHLDNGPVAPSAVPKRVMERLGVAVLTHLPAGSDGRRTAAPAKGQGRPALPHRQGSPRNAYHFHEPESKEEANRWLARFIVTYNIRVDFDSCSDLARCCDPRQSPPGAPDRRCSPQP
jgi:hypothetical protein